MSYNQFVSLILFCGTLIREKFKAWGLLKQCLKYKSPWVQVRGKETPLQVLNVKMTTILDSFPKRRAAVYVVRSQCN